MRAKKNGVLVTTRTIREGLFGIGHSAHTQLGRTIERGDGEYSIVFFPFQGLCNIPSPQSIDIICLTKILARAQCFAARRIPDSI